MTAFATRSKGRRGPTPWGLGALALSAAALLATSPGYPTLASRVIGEVTLGGGESVERELRIHVDPEAAGATGGSIELGFQAASGLGSGYTQDVTIELAPASDAGGSFEQGWRFALDDCASGCDRTYRVRLTAAPGVLPGSVVRYDVSVRLEYANGYPPDPSLMRLDLEGAAGGPVTPLWGILMGLLALVGGIAAGPAVHRRLGPGRRDLPAGGVLALAAGMVVWMAVGGLLNLARYDALSELMGPNLFVAVVDPWSVALLLTLAWGVWLGVRRWPTDGGWLLGLAAVAAIGLGGLWLAWWSTLDVVFQPIAVSVQFALLGLLGGVVIGQAWRTNPVAHHDRWWTSLAVLAHGVVIAGFGFRAEEPLYDPFSSPESSPALLLAALLVVLAFHRWLGGRRRWLILFDAIIAAVGLLGLALWSSPNSLVSPDNGRGLQIDDVAVWVAVIAAVIAFVTSLHVMPRASKPGGGDPATAADGPPTAAGAPVEAPISPLEPPGDARSTT